MKIRIKIGSQEQEVVRIKEFSKGVKIVESDRSNTILKGKEPIKEMTIETSKLQKEKFLRSPNDFLIKKGKLERKKK